MVTLAGIATSPLNNRQGELAFPQMGKSVIPKCQFGEETSDGHKWGFLRGKSWSSTLIERCLL